MFGNKLLAIKVANIEQIVRTYGLKAVEAYRDEISSTTTDPLALLHTVQNWRLWLEPEDYVVFLAKRLQVLVYGEQAIGADPGMDMIGAIVQCIPFRQMLGGSKEEKEGGCTGCAWRECKWQNRDDAGVKLMACKGCGEVRYCGRECQRRDWLKGGHKGRCGTRLKRSDSETSTESGSGGLVNI
ncbi:hypothetical protein PENSPDRAFT_97104 [Peniophora sp. CONT]|nr:hypothetical protein PENSPDRAFT_97104 [Peniophora sp. CONT]